MILTLIINIKQRQTPAVCKILDHAINPRTTYVTPLVVSSSPRVRFFNRERSDSGDAFVSDTVECALVTRDWLSHVSLNRVNEKFGEFTVDLMAKVHGIDISSH